MEDRSESQFCEEVKILLRKDLPMLIYNEIFLLALDARVNGGKKGFHILKLSNDGRWVEEVWDDPRQRLINEIRARHGLTGSILFDVKSYRNVTRIAGEWQLINDGYDVERFLDYWRV